MKTSIFALLATLALSATASPQVDDEYALKNLVAGVVNLADEPVHGGAVENAVLQSLRENHRFEISEAGQAILKTQLGAGLGGSLGDVKQPAVSVFAAALRATRPAKAHGAVLAEVVRRESTYSVLLVMVNIRNLQVVATTETEVADSRRLDSFISAARSGMADLDRAIPFQASVVNRDGYRLILDRGLPYFHQGMQLSVYSLESWQGTAVFEETGMLQITRVERNLSFARVVSDKRPREISVGNKLILGDRVGSAGIKHSYWGRGRSPASLSVSWETRRQESFGVVDFKLGPSLIEGNQTGSDGSEVSTGNQIYSGASLSTEILLTSRLFTDLELHFASSFRRLRGALGVRLSTSRMEPSLDLKLGYASQSYNIASATSSTYTGLLAGIAGRFPLAENFGLGFEINALLFPALSESPVTSGASVTAVRGLDFGVRAYYDFTKQIDLALKLVSESHSAEFAGRGTRATSLTSASQSHKSLLLGLSYYF